jgi:hypothetical protein
VLGVFGILLMIAVGTSGCTSTSYAPPAGANTSPSNINVQVTIEEAWTGATNQPVATTVDLTFTLAGTSRPIDLTADGTVVCQGEFVSFSSGTYSFRLNTPPSAYTCTYTHNSNNQKASFTISHEPAPVITSPRYGAQLPSNTNVPIDYQVIKTAPGEAGIAVLTTMATTTSPDADFHEEPGLSHFKHLVQPLPEGPRPPVSRCSRSHGDLDRLHLPRGSTPSLSSMMSTQTSSLYMLAERTLEMRGRTTREAT